MEVTSESIGTGCDSLSEPELFDRYEMAQKFLQGIFSNKCVRNDIVLPHWVCDEDCFWYSRQTEEGREFRFVDAVQRTNTVAFDHFVFAESLKGVTGEVFDARDLSSLTEVSITREIVRFRVLDNNWLFDKASGQCSLVSENETVMLKEGFDIAMGYEVALAQQGLISPDSKKVIFVRDYNLWIRELSTGKESALTDDGCQDNYYATFRIPILDSGVQAAWSPDSNKIFTIQVDVRHVTKRPMIHYVPRDGGLQPQLEYLSGFPYAGDEHLVTKRLLIIDINSFEQVPVKYRQLQGSGAGSEMFSHLHRPFAWWGRDSLYAYFVDMSRGSKTARIVELNTEDGSTRTVFEESSETFVRLCHMVGETPLFMALPETDEIIWFSERTGWGHLYLINIRSGKIKRQITGCVTSSDSGQWLVRDIVHYDPEQRELLIQTAGRDSRISPYYRDLCKVNIDSGELIELAGGNFENIVYQKHNMTVIRRGIFGVDYPNAHGVSSDGKYIVVTRSRVDTIPESILLDRDGNEVLLLEQADISGLPTGWSWPEPFKVKGDAGDDIYGVIFRPPNFSENKLYPVLDYSGGLRFYSSVPVGSFGNSALFELPYFSASALAALGFIVVAMEGRGTPCRNKSFSEHLYGEPSATSDLNDRVCGLRQLASQYPYFDLSRVGIAGVDGHSASIFGLLDHPDFYKVAVIHIHNDPRFSDAEFSETFDGVPAFGETSPEVRHAEDSVGSMRGKLLLIDGMLNFANAAVFRLIHALEKANKTFDILPLTTAIHDVPSYAVRREWDYFVTHLLKEEPPQDFSLTSGIDLAIVPMSKRG